ncbi:MAG: dTDP-4-dehydrorhamnose reductase [Chloroflexi bacterium AL-W]|nr:dTDP-4-dehydrorhamnose reductase [Chloroflexi bacterium AL-N1]NOK65275.1 dTDP-4-dehydrorhamnose reductase [Chloroflexi bacterium AL-N10]NOK72460.1 dTDP-4-dehydrorhamnose reductase [Chloroflexi bacterium AL-N5]NOK79454.1 dTDP-4-dehydrorhamnose reductase [Chloroflexi bacterium AL-W]NOK87370.1 dTDP-4-dehydrorhamnose reductase [Chloroflexi bacterium AL-N15]
MRIVITGAHGQFGQDIQTTLGTTHEIIALGRDDCDLEHSKAIECLTATNADVIVHPAAYTNVDGCARDPQRAYRVNTLGTKYVALACQQLGARLVYVSTNEVFDGHAERPYVEYDTAAPINSYGWSKWGGEQVVRELLQQFYIVRVAWLFGGERNFVCTVLRLIQERDEIAMVADEVGSPTYTVDAAAAIAQLIETPCYGTYHIVNDGACSRYEFARTIMEIAGAQTILQPMALQDYKRDSVVPSYTPLDNVAASALGIRLRPWQEAVRYYIEQLNMSL